MEKVRSESCRICSNNHRYKINVGVVWPDQKIDSAQLSIGGDYESINQMLGECIRKIRVIGLKNVLILIQKFQ